MTKDTSTVDKLADIIDKMLDGYALGDTPDAESIADAIADSGFLFELEERARMQVAREVEQALNDPYKRASLQNALNVLDDVATVARKYTEE